MAEDSAALSNDKRFQDALNWQSENISSKDKLKNILNATTILTPILQSDAVFAAWRHSFFTEHWLDLTNPVEDIPQQLQSLQMTIRKMMLTGQTSDADVQALVNNSII